MQDYRPTKKKKKGMWPVIGFVMALALGAISWVLAPHVYRIIRERLPQFSTGSLTEDQMTAIVGVFVFVVLVALASAIVAAFAPRKQQRDTRDAALRKEKEAMLQAEKKRRESRRKAEAQIRQHNREMAKRKYEEQQRRKEQEEERG
ncbi:MAG: hypothetical protein ACUVSX_00655 [Aggregatilineales bacterium]